MKIKKIIIKIIVAMSFVVVISLPIVMMYMLSQKEMEKYTQNNVYEFREAAYGEPRWVTREDIKQYFTFDGSVTSDEFKYIEFDKNQEADIKAMVEYGAEVKAGDVIAYVNQQEIKAECNGIVEEVNPYAGGYIKLRSIDELKLTCMADRSVIDKLSECKELKLEDGRKVSIDFISNIAVDNQVKIVFSIDSLDYMYGQEISDLRIYTDKVYKNVLVVDKDCVYQKNENGPYYVRVLDEYDMFDREVEVEIGFETEEVVSILNIEENTICDSGYKELIEAYEE